MLSDVHFNRFVAKFTIGDGCWEWTGARSGGGYGAMKVNGRMMVAHRLSYEEFVGPIPDGLVIDHLCRNRRCVRPAHLEPVTHLENVGRGHAGHNGLKTHCPKGHSYGPGNVKFEITKGGGMGRRCLICRRAQHRVRYYRLKARI